MNLFPLLSFFASACLASCDTDPLLVVCHKERMQQVPEGWAMGTCVSPSGDRLGYGSRYLIRNGDPWMPVMGEYHFSRYDSTHWLRELRKIKAGGVDVVATYVFWNHHEEKEGEWDWSGSRDLRRFVEAAQEAGLLVILRIGPWGHGEVRYGGLPDWVMEGEWQVRSADAAYLEKVAAWYGAIARQAGGLLWKDGGPVIGVQLDNEYPGPASHLLKLKELAVSAGFDTPFYTRTGWPGLQDSMPFGEMLPLFGAYAEGFWNHSLEPMPGNYREGFHFSQVRTSSDIGSDQFESPVSEDELDARRYPFLTCELGGGMMNSYHRRVLIEESDVLATTLVKFGSGGNLLGYYMYHGGWNPEGRYSNLQESLMTRYPNDMPVKNYDFQAPVGAAGTLRPHYHALRQVHLFIRDFGQWVARLDTFLPDIRPAGLDDTDTLRWSVRSNGHGGLLFFNNYERLNELGSHEVRFRVDGLDSGSLEFPREAVHIRNGDYGFWPFRMELAPGFEVEWITAQPLCRVQDPRGDWYVFFRPTEGVPVELAMPDTQDLKLIPLRAELPASSEHGRIVFGNLEPGRDVVFTLENEESGIRCHLVLLTRKDADRLWKGPFDGLERVMLANAGIVFRDDCVELRPVVSGPAELLLIPMLERSVLADGVPLELERRGGWSRVGIPLDDGDFSVQEIEVEWIQDAGEPREIPIGPFKSKVAMAPVDHDFDLAAKWRIPLPDEVRSNADGEWVLDLEYVGDVLRIGANGELWIDDFYNGRRVEVPLRELATSHGCSLESIGSLELSILPLRPDAPVYLHPSVSARLSRKEPSLELRSVVLKMSRPVTLSVGD
ncbi:MAG: beta-galactosidase [Opitutales bacterium]|nr:beta-galactosidase [Opitutales bacterium]